MQDAAARDVYAAHGDAIATLAGPCPSCTALDADSALPAGAAVAVLDSSTKLYLHLHGLLDPATELAKLRKQLASVKDRLQAMRARREAPAYSTNTPEDVRAKDEAKAGELVAELQSLNAAMADMQLLAQQQGSEQQGARDT